MKSTKIKKIITLSSLCLLTACTRLGDTPKRKPSFQYTIDYSFVYEKDNQEGRINISQSCKFWENKFGKKLFEKSMIGSGNIHQCSRHFPLVTENDAVLYTISDIYMLHKIRNNGGSIILKYTGNKSHSGISFFDDPDKTPKHLTNPSIRLVTAHYDYFFNREFYNKYDKKYLKDFSYLRDATFKRVEARLREGVFAAPDWADTDTNKK